MTAAMRQMHRRLHDRERYPLPPRELIQSLAGKTGTDRQAGAAELQDLTLGAHFAYGAAAGALYALARTSDGIVAGTGYPPPAASQRADVRGARGLGATTAAMIRELRLAEAEVFAGPAAPDAADSSGPEIPRRG